MHTLAPRLRAHAWAPGCACMHRPGRRGSSSSSRGRLVPQAGQLPNGDDILSKYGLAPGDGSAQQPAGKAPRQQPQQLPGPAKKPAAPAPGNGVFALLALNLAFFVADHVLHLPFMQALYLNHAHPRWWQWVTHAFCHANASHLGANLFNLCVFGKLVEETEGASGVWFTYIVTALGAAAASVLVTPAVVRGAVSVSVGASGAIFGLFAVSVLTRLTWDPRRLLEGLILGQFVVRQVLGEARAQAAGGLTLGGLQVAHVAHLGGAAAGVLLVWLLTKLPDPGAQ